MSKNSHNMGWLIFLIVFGLLLFRIPVLISAGAGKAIAQYGSGAANYLIINQLFWSGAGIVVLFIAMSIPYSKYATIVVPFFGKKNKGEGNFQKKFPLPIVSIFIITVMLIVVYFCPEKNGTHRWIPLGLFSFQPSELARYVFILYFAWTLTRENSTPIQNYFHGFLPKFLLMLAFIALIVFEPHYSATGIIFGISFVLFYFARAQAKQLVLTYFIVAVLGLSVMLMVNENRRIRFYDFIGIKTEQVKKISKAGLSQNEQALVAFGRGGITGVNAGKSVQRDNFLPEPTTDFVYAIIGEEYGFLGAVTLVGFFLMIILQGLRIAARTQDEFGKLLAIGLTTSIGLQVLINMTVALGLFVNTGLPMPFLSDGGTSLIVSSFAIGVLLNISRHTSDGEAEDNTVEIIDDGKFQKELVFPQ